MKTRNIPFGYRYDNGVIVLHPDESKTVKEIFREYLQGQSLLKLANELNEHSVEYMPGVTGWNKARIKRLIDDERYLGNETYPQIIEQNAFSRAQNIKAERNTQKTVDRTAEIFQMMLPVLCEECGQPLRRIHDSRRSYNEKWICQDCGAVVKIQDEKLLKAITECLNTVIAKPCLADIPKVQTAPPLALCRMENEIGRMLDSASMDKEMLKNKIFECAALKYSELDTTERTTQLLRAVFEKSRPLSLYDRELAERTVTAVTLYADSSVGLILKNGQQIRKEQHHATDSHNTAKAGTHNTADHTAGEHPKYSLPPQARGGILPCVNQ